MSGAESGGWCGGEFGIRLAGILSFGKCLWLVDDMELLRNVDLDENVNVNVRLV